jgi:hypothetical protein
MIGHVQTATADRGAVGAQAQRCWTAVDVLRQRRRRRAEASGEPYMEVPLGTATLPPGRRLSVAEPLRSRRLGGERATAK